MEPVRSHRNKIVVDAARLHRARTRRELGRTLIEGPNLIAEALAAGMRVDAVFALEDDEVTRSLTEERGLRLTLVDTGALRRIADTDNPRGPIAIVDIPGVPPDRRAPLLVAWGLGDPGNVGTLIRLAAAFGWGFAHTPGTTDPWSPKALRAGAGGQFQTAVWPIGSLQDLDGWITVASVVEGGEAPDTVTHGPIALLIGEEASGLPADVITAATYVVSIPTPGPTESLNAASAAAILVHELSKPGGHGGQRV